MNQVTHRIKHDLTIDGHSHTVMTIELDDLGHYWLSFRCGKHDCTGERLAEVLPEQVKCWQQSGVIVVTTRRLAVCVA